MSRPYREELVLLTQVTPKVQLGSNLLRQIRQAERYHRSRPLSVVDGSVRYGPTFFLWSFVGCRLVKFHFNDINKIYMDRYYFNNNQVLHSE